MGFVYFIILLAAIYWSIDYNKYKNSSYRKTTGYSYFKARFNTGFYGEYLSFEILNKLPGNKRIFTNVYVPKENGETTEIDVVMLHEKGIFVIESKNYSGWIFGDEKSKYWTQSFKNGRKERFYNPIWQNQTHIRHLMRVLGLEDKAMVKSIIAFSERCELKKLKVFSEDIKVINRYKLARTVNEMIKASNYCFTDIELEGWKEKLSGFVNVSEEVKKMHVEKIERLKG